MEPKDTWFKDLIEHLDEGVYFVDPDRLITFWNKGAAAISGFPGGEVVGHHCFANILRHVDGAGRELCFNGCPLLETLGDGRTREANVYLHHKEGHRVPVRVRTIPVRDDEGRLLGAMEVFQDRTERLEAVSRIRELERDALIDPLTGIANRRYTEIELQARVTEFERYGWSFGVLFADVDHFKRVNDRWGHEVGDQALRVVARTLSAGLRSHDFVGRWGGEEFLVVITRVEQPGELEVVASRLRNLVARSGLVLEGGDRVGVTASLGGTVVRGGDDAANVVARADHLMFESKREGRNRVTIG